MLPSALVNLLLAALAITAVARHAKKAPMKIVLRFFTVLSNLLCAAAAIVFI